MSKFEVNEICSVCREELDDYGDCLCTKGKPGMREAVKWLKTSDAFDGHEGSRVADLVKMIDTPVKRLDSKISIQPQLAASVAALYTKYLKRALSLELEKERLHANLSLEKRKRYDSVKGTSREKPWKIFEYEIKIDPRFNDLQDRHIRADIAQTFLGDLTSTMKSRGHDLQKMSDDRRQKLRIDAESRDL